MKTQPHSPWLHRYAMFVAFCTFILIIAGALAAGDSAQSPVSVAELDAMMAPEVYAAATIGERWRLLGRALAPLFRRQ